MHQGPLPVTDLGLCDDVGGQLDHGKVTLADGLFQLILADSEQFLAVLHAIGVDTHPEARGAGHDTARAKRLSLENPTTHSPAADLGLSCTH